MGHVFNWFNEVTVPTVVTVVTPVIVTAAASNATRILPVPGSLESDG